MSKRMDLSAAIRIVEEGQGPSPSGEAPSKRGALNAAIRVVSDETSAVMPAAAAAVAATVAAEPEKFAPEVAADGGARSLRERLRTLPCWAVSLVVHAVAFLLIGSFAARAIIVATTEVIVTTDVAPPEPEKPEEIFRERDVFERVTSVEAEVEAEHFVLIEDPEAEITDHFETDEEMDLATAKGDEEAVGTLPEGGSAVMGLGAGGFGLGTGMGVGAGGGSGLYGFRSGGGRKKCVRRFGGNRKSESAVEAALKWLADHQENDGRWSCPNHGGRSEAYDPAMTGFAVLAFLGAGYTTSVESKYQETVQEGVDWLLEHQRKDGCFFVGDRPHHLGYIHAIAGLALAEAYGMSRDEELRESAQKAVDYSVNVHQCPYSGWRYNPRQKGDSTVSGWFVMQLKSAKVAGLVVDGKAFQGAINFYDEVTDPKTGMVGYTAAPKGGRGGSPRRTAIGLVCRQFLGGSVKSDPLILKEANFLAQSLPVLQPVQGQRVAPKPDFYYWYYGMLGMFQVGGRHWKAWNKVLRDRLIQTQCKAGDDNDGSWDYENDQYGRKSGRVFTTALGALCLEVYYRYLPMYTR